MSKIEVHDGTSVRVEAIKFRAMEILDKLLDECAEELATKEPDIPVSEGITLAAWMTAAYSLYYNLANTVRKNGGTVYPMPTDSSDSEDMS